MLGVAALAPALAPTILSIEATERSGRPRRRILRHRRPGRHPEPGDSGRACPPSWEFWLTLVSIVVGTAIGPAAGPAEPARRRFITWIMDGVMAFPTDLLAISSWPRFGRASGTRRDRAAFAHASRPRRSVPRSCGRIRLRDAARAIGAEPLHLARHVLANSTSPIIVRLPVAAAMLGEAALGLPRRGSATGDAGVGGIIASDSLYLSLAWWISIFPGAAGDPERAAPNLVGRAAGLPRSALREHTA